MKSVAINQKNYIKVALFLLLSLLVVGSIFSTVTKVYAQDVPPTTDSGSNGDGSTPTTSSDVNLDNISQKSSEAIAKVQKPIVTIALAVGGLAMIICIVLILFTHDERKIQGYIKLCITIAIALVVIGLINGGVIIQMVQDIVKALGGNF